MCSPSISMSSLAHALPVSTPAKRRGGVFLGSARRVWRAGPSGESGRCPGWGEESGDRSAEPHGSGGAGGGGRGGWGGGSGPGGGRKRAGAGGTRERAA